jgi:DNA end-binding protein Ku
MLDLAKHIVESKSGHFDPSKFEDHYEAALQELLEKKQKGQPIAVAKKSAPSNVYNLMDALRASIKGGKASAAADKPARVAKKSKPSRPAAKRKTA